MNPRIVSFHYILTSSKGETIESSRGGDPLSFLEGSNQIIPGLENRLRLMQAGDRQSVNVPAAEAYGERDDTLRLEIPRDKFKEQEIQIGDQFNSNQHPGSPPLTVVAIDEKNITLDANHPLAGQDLTFDVEVMGTREATDEEMSHGHVHGPGGAHD